MESNTDCPVCFQLNLEPVRIKCNHVFCVNCIEKILTSGTHRCPMDRSEFDFKKDLTRDLQILERVKISHPNDYQSLLEKNRENVNYSNIKELGIEYGNYHRILETDQSNCHEWKAFVRVGKFDKEIRNIINSLRGNNVNMTSNENFDIKDSNIIKKVTFNLHPTFRPNIITQDKPPFAVRRIGWGAFNIGIIVEFQDNLNLENIELNHFLCFSRNLKKDTKYITIDVNKSLINK